MLSVSVIGKANALEILNSEGIKKGKKSDLWIGIVQRGEGYHQENKYGFKNELLQFVKRKIGVLFLKRLLAKAVVLLFESASTTHSCFLIPSSNGHSLVAVNAKFIWALSVLFDASASCHFANDGAIS